MGAAVATVCSATADPALPLRSSAHCSILNKLTVENFDSLSDQLVRVGISNENVLKGTRAAAAAAAAMAAHPCLSRTAAHARGVLPAPNATRARHPARLIPANHAPPRLTPTHA